MKKLSISILCIFLAVIMSGCGKSDTERVQDYLEKRYGEEFVVIDTKATSYGGPAFSYDLTASCYPVDNPEYIFLAEIIRAGTEEKTYSDCYAQGILNKRTQDKIVEKLADFPAEFSVFVKLCNNSQIKLENMEDIDYESYFLESLKYRQSDAKLQPIRCYVEINADSYDFIGYENEYDLFYRIIREISAELNVDCMLYVRYVPQELYNRSAEWYSKHPVDSFGMPTNYYYEDYKFNGEFFYEAYEFDYSLLNDELTSFYTSDDAMTKEIYISRRKEGQFGNEE